MLAKYTRANPLVSRMLARAMNARLGRNWNKCITKLREWSKLIMDRYVTSRGAHVVSLCEIRESLSSIKNQASTEQAKNRQEILELRQTIQRLEQQLVDDQQFQLQAQLQSQVQLQSNARIESKMDSLLQLLNGVTPRGGANQITFNQMQVISPSTPPGQMVSPPPGVILASCHTASPTLDMTALQTPSNTNPLLCLQMGAAALDTTKNVKISDVLSTLYQKGALKNLKKIYLRELKYAKISNKIESTYKAAMDLVEALMTPEQRSMAIIGSVDNAIAMMEFMEINEWVIRATAVLQNSVPKGRRKSFWTGVGNIVKCSIHYDFIRCFITHDRKNTDQQPQLTLRQWVESEEFRIHAGSLK